MGNHINEQLSMASLVFKLSSSGVEPSAQELARLLPTEQATGLSLERIPILRPAETHHGVGTPPSAEYLVNLEPERTNHHYSGSFREAQLTPGGQITNLTALVEQINAGNIYIQALAGRTAIPIEGQLVAMAVPPAEERQSFVSGGVMGSRIKSHHGVGA